MNHRKYTPAPWILSQKEHTKSHLDETPDIEYWHIDAGVGFASGDEAGFGIAAFISEADAKLITAAPDMYEALKNILNGIDTGAITSDHDETFANAIKQAHDAIRKAEGI